MTQFTVRFAIYCDVADHLDAASYALGCIEARSNVDVLILEGGFRVYENDIVELARELDALHQWTDDDYDHALHEGWILHHNRIRTHDENGKLPHDDAAYYYVKGRAESGSKLHQKAMRITNG